MKSFFINKLKAHHKNKRKFNFYDEDEDDAINLRILFTIIQKILFVIKSFSVDYKHATTRYVFKLAASIVLIYSTEIVQN